MDKFRFTTYRTGDRLYRESLQTEKTFDIRRVCKLCVYIDRSVCSFLIFAPFQICCVVFVSSTALLLDNMLYMSIVPIAYNIVTEENSEGDSADKHAGNSKYAILFASKVSLVDFIIRFIKGRNGTMEKV